METGGDKLEEGTVPGRGKKRPPSPASSPSDDDDDDWEFCDFCDCEEEQEEEEDSDGEDYRDTATRRTKKSTSPSKKSKSKSLVDRVMTEQAKIVLSRNQLVERHLELKNELAQQKLNAKEEKIRLVQQMARDCGVDPKNTKLWYGVLKICKDEETMIFFIHIEPEGRLGLIEYMANCQDAESAMDGGSSDESSDEEFIDELIDSFLLDDDEVLQFMNYMLQFALHHDTCCNWAENRRSRRKKKSTARTIKPNTATREAKKSKSSTLRMMNDCMADMVKKQAAKNEYLKQAFSEKQQRKGYPR